METPTLWAWRAWGSAFFLLGGESILYSPLCCFVKETPVASTGEGLRRRYRP